MMHPLPPISQAYKIVLQEQKHKQISDVKTSSSETMAFIADRKRLHDSQYSRNNQDRNSYKYSQRKAIVITMITVIMLVTP